MLTKLKLFSHLLALLTALKVQLMLRLLGHQSKDGKKMYEYRAYDFTIILKCSSGWGASLEEFECVDAEGIL